VRLFRFDIRSTKPPRGLTTASVWVNEEQPATAEARARAYLALLGWTVDSIETSLSPTSYQLEQLSVFERECHRAAAASGVSAFIAPAGSPVRDIK